MSLIRRSRACHLKLKYSLEKQKRKQKNKKTKGISTVSEEGEVAFSVNFLHSSVQKQGEAATLFLTPGHLPCVDACCRARKAEIHLWVKSQHLLQLHFEFLHLRPSEGRDFTSGGQSSSRGNPMRAKILPNWPAS